MKKLLMSMMLASATYAGTFSTIGIEQFNKLQAKGVPVIDIRTPGEWKDTGIINRQGATCSKVKNTVIG